MNLIPYIFISLLGGLIIPLQLAIVGSFRGSTGASQIQATFYLYAGGAITSFILSLLIELKESSNLSQSEMEGGAKAYTERDNINTSTPDPEPAAQADNGAGV
ncbi:MAG: hypothetical protein ACWIPH_08810 [Ostreibacterium sp.]